MDVHFLRAQLGVSDALTNDSFQLGYKHKKPIPKDLFVVGIGFLNIMLKELASF
jgi:hypothetical protein